MNPPIITRSLRKLPSSPSSMILFRPLIPVEIVPKQPGQFASALAHEVRNPLSNINLAVEMLKSTIKDDDHKIFLDIIMRSSARINDLVTDLLTAFQADEKKFEINSVHQLLEEVLAISKDRITLKNIVISKNYTTLDCKILVNRQKIKVALANIIINAIEAMPSEKGKLKLVTKSINGKCVIEIEDNGIGISKENLKNIFKPFFTNKPGGMGLGLSTSLDILQASHAIVEVQSQERSGTRFILSFNRIQESGKILYSIPDMGLSRTDRL